MNIFEANFATVMAKWDEDIEKAHADRMARIAQNSANAATDAARRFEQDMAEATKETIKNMIKMKIPVKDIVDVYGDQKAAMDVMWEAARSGEISMKELNDAVWEHNKDLQQAAISTGNFGMSVDELKNKISADYNSILNDAKTTFPAISSIGITSVDDVNKAFDEMSNNYKTNSTTILQTANTDSSQTSSAWEDAMNEMKETTNTTVTAINKTLDKIKREIHTYHYLHKITTYGYISKGGGVSSKYVAFQEGGIVLRPTLGLLGEAGPEAVIPLNKARSSMPTVINYNPTINISAEISNEVDIDRLMNRIDDHIVGKLRQMVS